MIEMDKMIYDGAKYLKILLNFNNLNVTKFGNVYYMFMDLNYRKYYWFKICLKFYRKFGCVKFLLNFNNLNLKKMEMLIICLWNQIIEKDYLFKISQKF